MVLTRSQRCSHPRLSAPWLAPAEIHANPQAAAAAKRARLQQNEKEFREGVDRLYQLTGELREEVQKTPTTDVLSMRMVKKTEEIEKLAKVLKAKAKGG